MDEDPRRVLARLGVRPRKARGQHFLVDARIAARHVEHARVDASHTVLEIGPGLGVLTRRLAGRAKRVIAIESDPRFAAYLRQELPEVEVILGDALKVEWPPFDVIASNLPYQISSPVTFRLLDRPFRRAVLMYQWEFARRMIAEPGTTDYSRLTVGVYRRASAAILERVPRNAFHPQPRVDSALVSLEPRPPPFPLAHPERFDAVVEALFSHRRKTVENGLRLGWRKLAESREALEAALPGVPHRTRRAEDLSPEEIARIADATAMPKG
ncbi:MAG TPA: 16S rRNA (adenine(1518)-N(6)/adenine(1519)-N(6))-dimethyltransferase RsmA [Thermoplasmata archaeon]|nr:16S rRNA (adenine(1518)-N(6)/adenine(1519)-N(6))-dimethyltransferase RsmA [Thermoplasmata archaeon]